MTNQTCATCAFWERQGPQLAAAQRDPSCPAEQGTCQYAAPVIAPAGTFTVSIWPRTHQDRWCGRWSPVIAAGPDGGEVVQFRSKAA